MDICVLFCSVKSECDRVAVLHRLGTSPTPIEDIPAAADRRNPARSPRPRVTSLRHHDVITQRPGSAAVARGDVQAFVDGGAAAERVRQHLDLRDGYQL